MENFYPQEELRTERAWDLMRKLVKAKKQGIDQWTMKALEEALLQEYHTTGLLLSVDHPELDMEATIQHACALHENQMRVSLLMAGRLNERESFEVGE